MANEPTVVPVRREGESPDPVVPPPTLLQAAGLSIRARMISGLLLIMPILITVWLVHWLYSILEKNVIDPLALLVLWRFQPADADATLPFWFENFAAPVIAIVIVLVILYCLGFFIHSRLHRFVSWLLLRLPVVSGVYESLQKVFLALDKKEGQSRPQRVVLIGFPHPGLKLPAFVTGVTRDVATQRNILCVYVPTTPVPTSGYFLMVPEDEVVELNWTTDQALQSIISAGFTVPPEVTYFGKPLASASPAPLAKATDRLEGE